MRIHVDLDLCTGCRTCEVICSFSRNRKINSKKARVNVVRVDETGLDIPIICIQCGQPNCVEACPKSAILKDGSLGIVRVNEEECDGCGICADVCIIGAINIDPDSQMPLICDICNGKPKCVEWCATGAMSYNSSIDKSNSRARKNKWLYVLRKSKINVERWKLPPETLTNVNKWASK